MPDSRTCPVRERLLRGAIATLALGLCISLAGFVPADSARAAEASAHEFRVGAASRSILPLVKGGQDYLNDLPPPTDPFSVGNFVPQWDDGRIGIGNGFAESHWVRDDLRAIAVAIEDPADGTVAVLMALDLYMLLEPDVEQIRSRILAGLDPELAARTRVVIASTHTHHGPDSLELGPASQVNFGWMESMFERAAQAGLEAISSRRSATLAVARGKHWFGNRAARDPRIIDPAMNVLQARDGEGAVIATLVQWNGHPEMTLNWKPEVDGNLDLAKQCAAAVPPLANCTAEGRYHTADYPGHLRRIIAEKVGGEVLYWAGALGAMVSPWRRIWEVEDLTDLGDHYIAPAGAEFPGTGNVEARDFRRAALVGEMAGRAALEILAEVGEPLTEGGIAFAEQRFLTRLTNMGFRLLLRLDGQGRPFLGYTPVPLLDCPDAPADYANCSDDGFNVSFDGLIGAPVRNGNHLEVGVGLLRIGPVGMLIIPGEIQSHLVAGLPMDFDETYYLDPADHAGPGELEIPGILDHLVDEPYRWLVGLGNGALGYIMPISDWRVSCGPFSADCQAALGQPWISGAMCKSAIEDDGSVPAPLLPLVLPVCAYGQAIGQASNHYEETVAVGWDIARDLHGAVEALTGNQSSAQFNPELFAYWQGGPGIPPAAPEGIRVRRDGRQLVASWNPVAEAETYRVRIVPGGQVLYTAEPVIRLPNLPGNAHLRVSSRGMDWLRSGETVACARPGACPGPVSGR